MNIKIIVTDDQGQEQLISHENVKMLMTREDCIFLTFEEKVKKEYNFEGKAYKLTIKNY